MMMRRLSQVTLVMMLMIMMMLQIFVVNVGVHVLVEVATEELHLGQYFIGLHALFFGPTLPIIRSISDFFC